MIADAARDNTPLSEPDAPRCAAVTIIICDTCRRPGDLDEAPRAGAMLADATEAAAGDGMVRVRRVSCLANCKRGSSAAILREGGWSYVFGDLDPATAGPHLVAGAELFAASADGLMPWRGRPVSLKRGMIARVPPLNIVEETP